MNSPIKTTLSKSDIYTALEDVKDPEIPTISVVDLGIITGVKIEGGNVLVDMTPTFSGCPALKMLETLVKERVQKIEGVEIVKVRTSFDVQWNTNMISEKGRAALLKHGLAPPPKDGYLELDVLSDVACPFCGSRNTTMQSPFGATLCRSIHYCKNCLQGFEQFKPVG